MCTDSPAREPHSGAARCGIVVFGLIIVISCACSSPDPGAEPTSTPPPVETAFTDITDAAGLSYHGPSFAAAAADWDRDGWPDLAVSNHGQVALYRNLGNGAFGRLTGPDLDRMGDTHGVSWIDLGGTGWPDLIVSIGAERGRGAGSNWVFRNDHGSLIRDPTPPELLAYPEGRGRSVCPIHFTEGARPDLVVMNLYQPGREQRFLRSVNGEYIDATSKAGIAELRGETLMTFVPSSKAPIHALAYPAPPGQLSLLRFDGENQWTNVAAEMGVDIAQPIGAAASGDLDNDGDTDLVLVVGGGWPDGARVEQGNELAIRLTRFPDKKKTIRFSTRGHLHLELLSEGFDRPDKLHLGPSRVPLSDADWDGSPESPVLRGDSVEIGEDPGAILWSDGQELVFQFVSGPSHHEITGSIHSTEEITIIETENLRSGPKAPRCHVLIYEDGTYVDRAREFGLGWVGSASDLVLADLDNDADLDLFVLTGGHPFENPPNRLFLNNGNRTFTEIENAGGLSGPRRGRGASALAFDYDRDGDLDIFATNGSGPKPRNSGPYVLWRNDLAQGASAVLVSKSLESGGERPIAALVETSERRLFVSLLGSTGIYSNSELPVHIGLGPDTRADVHLTYPDGTVRSLLVQPGEDSGASNANKR